ncbi:hypothetical protein B0H13DRAFT_2378148 [Mycena leptocephala]|nr:hypothetical protein B0H13DRAFT_2378148 [Mycena leptocephala]
MPAEHGVREVSLLFWIPARQGRQWKYRGNLKQLAPTQVDRRYDMILSKDERRVMLWTASMILVVSTQVVSQILPDEKMPSKGTLIKREAACGSGQLEGCTEDDLFGQTIVPEVGWGAKPVPASSITTDVLLRIATSVFTVVEWLHPAPYVA